MSINDDAPTLAECMRGLVDERSRACDYYKSEDYQRHLGEVRALDRKLKERLGEKQWRRLFWYVSGIDAIHGEQLAGLQDSCYERGFNDALIMMGEFERAKNGLPTIFN